MTQVCGNRVWHRFESNYSTEICSGSEAGSCVRLMYFVYHSTLGLRVIKREAQESIVLRAIEPPAPFMSGPYPEPLLAGRIGVFIFLR